MSQAHWGQPGPPAKHGPEPLLSLSSLIPHERNHTHGQHAAWTRALLAQSAQLDPHSPQLPEAQPFLHAPSYCCSAAATCSKGGQQPSSHHAWPQCSCSNADGPQGWDSSQQQCKHPLLAGCFKSLHGQRRGRSSVWLTGLPSLEVPTTLPSARKGSRELVQGQTSAL